MRSTWPKCIAAAILLGLAGPRAGRADACSDAKAAVNSIETFTTCLNACMGAGNKDVSDAVQCLPSKCTVTVTMSPQSAQRACTLGGCQLPRIIFDCPGPSDGRRLRPSFLFCPVNSKDDDGNFGIDRIEIGEDNVKLPRPVRNTFATSTFDMKMADVPIRPGQPWVAKHLSGMCSAHPQM